MLQLPAWIDSAFVWLFFKAHHPEGEPEAAPKVARSAFLEGAREAGETKTYSGAIVKQKTKYSLEWTSDGREYAALPTSSVFGQPKDAR